MTTLEFIRSVIRGSAPVIALLWAVLLTVWPLELSIFSLKFPMPLLPLIVVYLYAVYDPDALPVWAVFSVGIIHDLIYGHGIGVWPSIYVALQFLVHSQRDYFRGRVFHVLWLAFVLALLILAPLLWLERSLIATRFLSIWPLLWQFALTALVYPAGAWIFFALRDRAFDEVAVK